MIEIPSSVRARFTDAGWHPGRSVPAPADVPPDHPAAAILAALGGLTVGECGDGETCATSDVVFAPIDGNSLGVADDVRIWGELLGTHLVGIGTMHHEHGAMFVDGRGRHFGMSLVHDAFWLEGEIFGAAMENLLPGRMGRPMLRPGQSSLDAFGETITADHPSVYRY